MDRRTFIGATAALSGAAASATRSKGKKPPLRVRRIATEESFNIPEVAAATRRLMTTGGAAREPGLAALMAGFDPQRGMEWTRSALDLGELRRSVMSAACIDTQLLLLSAPGVQIFDAAEGSALATLANDRAARLQRSDPHRFAVLATIAPQDPVRAAREMERAVRTLGLKGALVNSHTHGEYLDDRKFWPIFEAAQALDVPIYIHPRDPSPAMLEPYKAHALVGPIWGFNAETGLHALRLIMAGVFDQFPRLQIALGHLGEGLPFFIDRIDIRYAVDGSPARVRLKRRPSDYLKSNFVVTTSGMNFGPSVRQSIEVMGVDRVLFAADWPFEDAVQASAAFDAIPMSRAERVAILQRNAERVFRL